MIDVHHSVEIPVKSMRQRSESDMADYDHPSIFIVELMADINSEAKTNLHHSQ
jgi:hypothetical protein